jgi:hypothetical protein
MPSPGPATPHPRRPSRPGGRVRAPGSPCPSGRALSPGVARVPRRASCIPTRLTVVARCLTFDLTHFKFSLVNMLRRALRRATIHFKFTFIHVLHRALRRATIHFNFRLFNVWRRASSRATFCFKFRLDDVCRRALRRVTLDVIFIISSRVSWRAPSRDESIYS